MDWVRQMNEALKLLESQLTDELDLSALGRVVGLSPMYFQMVFSCMTGMTVHEYVRRRRMSLAAAELQAGARVLDVALKYGYQSPTAFNRAFRQALGMPPSEAQKPGARLKLYPPIRFQVTIKGAVEMNYHIETKEAFTVAGVKRQFDMRDSFSRIPQFWDELSREKGADGMGMLGVCIDPLEGNEFAYMIADFWDGEHPLPDGWTEERIPAFTWAVFPGEGELPDALQALNRRIFTEWLPSNGEWTLEAGYCVERYTKCEQFELWVPVKRAREQQ